MREEEVTVTYGVASVWVSDGFYNMEELLGYIEFLKELADINKEALFECEDGDEE